MCPHFFSDSAAYTMNTWPQDSAQMEASIELYAMPQYSFARYSREQSHSFREIQFLVCSTATAEWLLLSGKMVAMLEWHGTPRASKTYAPLLREAWIELGSPQM